MILLRQVAEGRLDDVVLVEVVDSPVKSPKCVGT
jgi:hypothetical protein